MAKSSIYTQPSPTAVGLGIADLAPLTNAVNLSAANMNVGSNSPNSVAPATPVGTVSLNTTAVASTATATAGTLMSYSLPANSLDQAGRGVYVKGWGIKAGNAANTSTQLVIGGVTYNSGSGTQSGVTWEIEGWYWSTGSNAELFLGKALTGAVVSAAKTQTDTAVQTSAISIALQSVDASAAATNQTAYGLWIEYLS